ncbi:DUF6090 family protein [Muriicola sp. Z0-33]|uniref:DUF6090 family protein n=1 Tax=Muriicola sp. Z0-33 TaxID=2816957 RepID=UPI0022372815|nr:DUF6090 family protein [Muriicola sp. Z0-33]MCW5518091.1 hypothetical protein [Muriicola sp. Z0-33]
MIKFFRRIRQQLLTENKFSKYLLYAIGEIVLVVIGILIALQINNWNEQRKTNLKEQTLLTALRQEFIHNRKELQAVIEINRNNVEAAGEFASILSPKKTNLSDREIAQYWDKAFRQEAIYRPSLGVLNEAINSGNLSIVRNNELRNILSSFDAELQQLRKQEETVFDFRLECYRSLRNSGNFRKILDNLKDTETWFKLSSSPFENSNKVLLQSERFENDIVLFIGISVFLENNFLIPLKNRMSESIQILNAEINK